jgi:beta-N-acetylhexosaminidase
MMSTVLPTLIYDIKGYTLTSEEKLWLKHPATAGIILFQRNYQDIYQLLSLTRSILNENSNLFITVDQEGGRIQRFKNGFSLLPSMRYWGEQYAYDPLATLDRLQRTAARMARELQHVNIAFSYAPVLDLDYRHNDVISDRSFHRDPLIVTRLAHHFIQGLKQQKMSVVGKHFPGHGFVSEDSHLCLPVDTRKKERIKQNDLVPFYQLSDKLDAVMPAHVVYSAVDRLPVCFSDRWLRNELRDNMHFNGAVITDDLNMAAVAELMSVEDCVHETLKAGCDFLLICNNQKKASQMLEYLEKKPMCQIERKQRVKHFISKVRRCVQP